jgi:hypothetical protein
MKKGGILMTTETVTEPTKDQNVPAIRSDSVAAYLSQLSAALNNIATDINMQVANITAGMSKKPETETDSITKENA